jgi:hypothetical protein
MQYESKEASLKITATSKGIGNNHVGGADDMMHLQSVWCSVQDELQ